MHELSIAVSIVDGVIETAKNYPGQRVAVIHLSLGVLSGVVKEALFFSYKLACANTELEGSKLEIKEVQAAIFCGECNAQKEIRSIQDLRCPICGTPSSNVVRGRELMIDSLELLGEYAATAG